MATIYAILAAALYAINVPLSKLLLQHAEPTMIAPFLGVMFSMVLLREKPELQFYIALLIMLVSTYNKNY